MDSLDTRIRTGLEQLASHAPAPQMRPTETPRHQGGVRLLALAAAAVVLLAGTIGVVSLATDDDGRRELITQADDEGSTSAPTTAGVPTNVGKLYPGTVVEGVPAWLHDFVVARGGVDGYPIVANDSLRLTSLGVLCPSPPTDGQPQVPLNNTTDCTFVYRYEPSDGSGASVVDLCLRRPGVSGTACSSEDLDEPLSVPGSNDQVVVFRRNSDFDPNTLLVNGIGADWGTLGITQTEFLTWRTTG